MTLGPRTQSLPPSSIPGTGSRRCSTPGTSLPTDPRKLYMGLFMESTGAVSVVP